MQVNTGHITTLLLQPQQKKTVNLRINIILLITTKPLRILINAKYQKLDETLAMLVMDPIWYIL